eukprot:g11974.t2
MDIAMQVLGAAGLVETSVEFTNNEIDTDARYQGTNMFLGQLLMLFAMTIFGFIAEPACAAGTPTAVELDQEKETPEWDPRGKRVYGVVHENEAVFVTTGEFPAGSPTMGDELGKELSQLWAATRTRASKWTSKHQAWRTRVKVGSQPGAHRAPVEYETEDGAKRGKGGAEEGTASSGSRGGAASTAFVGQPPTARDVLSSPPADDITDTVPSSPPSPVGLPRDKRVEGGAEADSGAATALGPGHGSGFIGRAGVDDAPIDLFNDGSPGMPPDALAGPTTAVGQASSGPGNEHVAGPVPDADVDGRADDRAGDRAGAVDVPGVDASKAGEASGVAADATAAGSDGGVGAGAAVEEPPSRDAPPSPTTSATTATGPAASVLSAGTASDGRVKGVHGVEAAVDADVTVAASPDDGTATSAGHTSRFVGVVSALDGHPAHADSEHTYTWQAPSSTSGSVGVPAASALQRLPPEASAGSTIVVEDLTSTPRNTGSTGAGADADADATLSSVDMGSITAPVLLVLVLPLLVALAWMRWTRRTLASGTREGDPEAASSDPSRAAQFDPTSVQQQHQQLQEREGNEDVRVATSPDGGKVDSVSMTQGSAGLGINPSSDLAGTSPTDDAGSTSTHPTEDIVPGTSTAASVGAATSAAPTATTGTQDAVPESSEEAALTAAHVATVEGDAQAPARERSVTSSSGFDDKPAGETAVGGVSASASACGEGEADSPSADGGRFHGIDPVDDESGSVLQQRRRHQQHGTAGASVAATTDEGLEVKVKVHRIISESHALASLGSGATSTSPDSTATLLAGTKINGREEEGGVEKKHGGRVEDADGDTQAMATADIDIPDGDTQAQAHVQSVASVGPIEEQPVGETAGSRAPSSAAVCSHGGSESRTADVDSSSAPSAALHNVLEIPAVVPSGASSGAPTSTAATAGGETPALTSGLDDGSAPPGAGAEQLEDEVDPKELAKEKLKAERKAERKLKAKTKAKQRADKKAKQNTRVDTNHYPKAGRGSVAGASAGELVEEGKDVVGPCHDVVVAEEGVQARGNSKQEVASTGKAQGAAVTPSYSRGSVFGIALSYRKTENVSKDGSPTIHPHASRARVGLAAGDGDGAQAVGRRIVDPRVVAAAKEQRREEDSRSSAGAAPARGRQGAQPQMAGTGASTPFSRLSEAGDVTARAAAGDGRRGEKPQPAGLGVATTRSCRMEDGGATAPARAIAGAAKHLKEVGPTIDSAREAESPGAAAKPAARAVDGIGTDSRIGSKAAGRAKGGGERELEEVGEAWVSRNATSTTALADTGGNEPWDQFHANERATFDENLYTSALDKGSLTPDQRRQAARKASEILRESSQFRHVREERNMLTAEDERIDEEERFSGVVGTGGIAGREHTCYSGSGYKSGFSRGRYTRSRLEINGKAGVGGRGGGSKGYSRRRGNGGGAKHHLPPRKLPPERNARNVRWESSSGSVAAHGGRGGGAGGGWGGGCRGEGSGDDGWRARDRPLRPCDVLAKASPTTQQGDGWSDAPRIGRGATTNMNGGCGTGGDGSCDVVSGKRGVAAPMNTGGGGGGGGGADGRTAPMPSATRQSTGSPRSAESVDAGTAPVASIQPIPHSTGASSRAQRHTAFLKGILGLAANCEGGPRQAVAAFNAQAPGGPTNSMRPVAMGVGGTPAPHAETTPAETSSGASAKNGRESSSQRG